MIVFCGASAKGAQGYITFSGLKKVKWWVNSWRNEKIVVSLQYQIDITLKHYELWKRMRNFSVEQCSMAF